VVAEDFVVVGFGDTQDEAVKDHDKNLEEFLQLCAARGIRLNSDKINLRKSEVPFIRHVVTDKGLGVDPAKVQTINEIPPPTDMAGV